jgi:hypothetical protein
MMMGTLAWIYSLQRDWSRTHENRFSRFLHERPFFSRQNGTGRTEIADPSRRVTKNRNAMFDNEIKYMPALIN